MMQIASLNNDLCHFSSFTLLKEAWTRSSDHKLIKKERNNGMDLNKSLIATSAEPLTMLPTASAKAYSILKNVNAEKMKKRINKPETTKDCLFCF